MKYLFLLFTFTIIISSCGKDPGISVDEYIAVNNLTTTELAEGVHIIIHAPGTGSKPNINSNIVIAFTGKFTDNSEFQTNDMFESNLSGLIRGWQIGLPEIAIGGSCTLIIPSDAAYGKNDVNGIPGGSTLIFDIDLLDIIL